MVLGPRSPTCSREFLLVFFSPHLGCALASPPPLLYPGMSCLPIAAPILHYPMLSILTRLRRMHLPYFPFHPVCIPTHSFPLHHTISAPSPSLSAYHSTNRFGDLLSNTIDLQGFSHQSRVKLDQCHAKLPHKPIYMSE